MVEAIKCPFPHGKNAVILIQVELFQLDSTALIGKSNHVTLEQQVRHDKEFLSRT
jgi:hypothetical protein